MTKEWAVKNAQAAFIVASDVGVDEDSLIESIFEATMERELLAIINERKVYSMKEFAEHCQCFTNQARV
jgi:hypothetical protein